MILSSQDFIKAMIAPVATLYTRIELLDKNENLIQRFDTKVIDGSISVDKDRDVRRQFSLRVANDDNSFTWSVGGAIWIDKRIRISVGFMTLSGIEYVPQGVFLLESPTVISKADGTREVTLKGGDKWKQFDGQPLGKFQDVTTVQVGVNVGDAIRTLATNAGELKFAFDSCSVTVPYTLTYQVGESVGKAIKELADLAVYSCFYDVNGYLRFKARNQDYTTLQSTWTYDKSAFTLYAGSEKTLDEKELYNSVLVIGGSSQTATVSATSTNSDSSSPISTVNIGTRLFVYNNGSPDPLITTQALAQARADYELAQHAKVVERQRFEAMPNFLHDAEDVITLIDDWTTTNDNYELIKFNISLKIGDLMQGDAWRVRKVV